MPARVHNRVSICGLLATCGVAAGCYAYVPLGAAAPASAARIVAMLTDSGTVQMGNALGAGALEVEGVVVSAMPETWTLNMIRVDHRAGASILWNREVVTFPRAALANPRVMTLNRKKSWLAAGGITVGALLIARSFDLLGAGDERADNPTQANSVRSFKYRSTNR